jgi:antitoxin component of RelBE/YafQ-DinJ toxin-antitoxin module
VIIITKRLKLDGPRDVRNLIKVWLKEVADTGQLPFEGRTGGVVVQMLNCWLKSYELEKTADVEKRLKVLEAANEGKR